jgi:hypothetical protein
MLRKTIVQTFQASFATKTLGENCFGHPDLTLGSDIKILNAVAFLEEISSGT